MKKIISVLLCVLMVFTLIPVMEIDVSAFVVRTSKPADTNMYYIQTAFDGNNECVLGNGAKNGYVLPNDTGYVWGRVYEISGTKPNLCTDTADMWYSYNETNNYYGYGTQAKAGAVACWKNHVAFVESVNEDGTINVSQSHYEKKIEFEYYENMNPKEYLTGFQGYIYPLETFDTMMYYEPDHPHRFVYRNADKDLFFVNPKETCTNSHCSSCPGLSEKGYKIDNFSFPRVIQQGTDITVGGNLSSTEYIRWVIGVIRDADKNELQRNTGKYPGAKTYDLANINDQLDFSALPVGSYYFMLIIQSQNIGQMNNIYVPFEVKSANYLWSVKNVVSPEGKLIKGEDFEISGNLFCVNKITWANARILDSTGTEILQISEKSPQKTSFSVSELNDGLDFSVLEPGTYIYQLKAGTGGKGDMSNVERTFTILDTYEVSYDANGGSGAPDPQTKIQGEDLGIPSTIPKWGTHEFLGWSTDKSATTPDYKPSTVFSTDKATKLYAVWKHPFEQISYVEPTCTTSGEKSYLCTCGEAYTVSLAAKGHLCPQEWTIDYEAYCTRDGLMTKNCKVCGVRVFAEDIPATGHSWGSPVMEVAPTCTEEGEKISFCTKCDAVGEKIFIPATGHSYGDWEIVRLATSTTPGERRKTCSKCNDYISDNQVEYKKCVVTFISNGGECDTLTEIYIAEEQMGTLPVATREMHSFKGWTYTNGGTDYVKETDTVTADTKLYASWELISPESAEVLALPVKTGYCVGDEVETRGLKLLVTYNDGSTKTVSSGFETEYDFSKSGETTVEVTYTERNVSVATSYDVYVNEPARLYSDTLEANAGETVDVPVYIENNPGIVGFTIYVEYDDTVFTPVCVNGGDVSGYGMFDDNVGYESENKVQITWSGTENYYDDGELFNITFDVSADSTVRGDYSFEISYEQADTFDENTNDVTLECESTTVTVINEQKEPVEIGGGTVDATAGQMVDIPVNVINNRDLAGSDLTITYDSNILTFVSVAEGLATVVADDSTTGELVVNLETVTQTEQGTLFSVRFKVKDYSSGTEKITITSSDSEIVVKNISVEITNPYADMATVIYSDSITGEIGDTVLVPVYVENNQGMYGFKIRVTYDSNLLKPASYCKGESIITSCGSINTNISKNTKAGKNYFDIMYYGDELFNENGKMFTLKFTLKQAAPGYTSLNLSYSQADTFTEINGVETDVVLDCRNIGFKTTGCFVDSDKVYLSELNDSSTIDLLSWLPSAVSAVIKNMVTANGSGYGTGTTFDYIADGITTAYTIIVKGDADGDSAIDVLDVMHVERASNNQEAFTDAQTDAGDLNGDGEITAEDYSAMVNLVLH